MNSMVLLSVNAGSSSLKVSVFDPNEPTKPRTSLFVEGIGSAEGALIPNGVYGSEDTKQLPIASFVEAADHVKSWLNSESIQSSDVIGIGYRVVHGGEKYKEAAEVTPEMLGYLESITPLAPNHMPAALTAMRAFLEVYPDATHVACFDTSFFHDIPAVAKTLPIPINLQEEHNIRRYGFHGLSYQYLLASFTEHEGEEAAKGRIIMAHLGSGASLTAVKEGAPIDMSMGFTPVSGIMMSTRSGDIEPGVLTYLQKEKGLSAEEVADMVTYKSGLLGVSGYTTDMLTLLNEQHDNPHAALAVELFCYKITKTIGGYIAALGGVDSIIFSGGIGERSAEIRRRILANFGYIGLEVDEARNASGERLISTDTSKVGIHVIPAQEDYSIVTQSLRVIHKGENN